MSEERKSKRTKVPRFIIVSLLCIAFVMSMLPALPTQAKTDETEVIEKTLYYLSFEDERAMGQGIPHEVIYPTDYKIDLTGFNQDTTTIKVIEGSSVEVNDEGLVQPRQIMLGQAKAWGYTRDLDVYQFWKETPNASLVYIPYPSTVKVSDGTKTVLYKFELKDYADVYVDEKLNSIINKLDLGKYQSEKEKLCAITEYVANNTDYANRHSYLKNMVIYECGDCIATSRFIKALAIKTGIKDIRLRRSFQDQNGEGDGHVNVYAVCDGQGYKCDVWAADRPRGSEVVKETDGFCMVENTLYQYDGLDDRAIIPEKVGNTKVTTIGRTDRFDSTKYASIFYNLFDSYDGVSVNNVKYVRIPATVTTINPGALSGSNKLGCIEVDSDNKNYSSSDDGCLYSKNQDTLYLVPAAKQETYMFNYVKNIDEHAFDDVKELDIYYQGTESDWNKISKPDIPDKVHVYFGHNRVEGIKHNDDSDLTFKNRYEMKKLNCSVVPENAANTGIKYTSSDESVVMIINGNEAYAVGEGKCTITATAADGWFYENPLTTTYNVTCAFEGYNLTLEGGEIVSVKDTEGKELNGYAGLSSAKILEDYTVTIQSDGSYGDFKSWTFPDGLYPITETESNTGKVTFVMPNKSTSISAMYYNTPVSRIIDITAEGGKTTICEGESVQLIASVEPEWAHTKKIKWESSNTGNLIIDENGVATGVAAGSQIRVTATALDKLGATKTVYISVQPHESDDVEKTIIQHGDCTETSTIVEYTCPDCGMRVREVIQPEHSWKHSGSKEKTCTEDGYDEYTCEVCGSVDKIVDKAPGHDYQDVAKEDATCTEPGHEAGRRCTRCGDIETGCEEIPKKGHDYQHVDETPATCTVDGCTEGNVCTRCGDVETGRTRIPAQGHKWSEWKVTKEATETTEGVKTRTCSKCGTKETDTIKKKEKSGGNSGSGSGNGNNSGNGKNGAKKYSNEWVDGKWYNADGTQTYTGTLQWKSDASGWWVEDTDGWYPTDSWQKIDGVWYYFKPSGYMAMGEYYGGYWFNKDGSWDDQYLLSWKSDSTGWWVEDKSGWWPQSSWLQIDGYWYYFKSDGYMATSQYVDGYLISSDGVCY